MKKTEINLMKAFAGESMARNRYTFAADLAKKQKLAIIEKLFTFTADQEKEHAKIFYDHLKSVNDQQVIIDTGYPVNLSNSILDHLKNAVNNEMEEYENIYKEFGNIAHQEGLLEIANSFYKISEIEKEHALRFAYFHKLMQDNKLFNSDKEERWLCLNCGHIHVGRSAPLVCEVCSHPQGYFIRYEDSFGNVKDIIQK